MQAHSSTNTIILGAGVSGLTAAFALSQHSREDCAIYEQASAVGGLCRSIERNGFRLEMVTHVLHFRSDQAQELVQTLLDGNLLQIERSAWVYFAGRYVPYPFQTHLGFLPLLEKVSCMANFWSPWIRNKFNGARDCQNFEDWIHEHFGSGIGRHFMVPYNTKLWGIAPRDMSTDWVKRFVPRSSLRGVMAGFLLRRSREVGYNAYFFYPKSSGMQALIDALEASVPRVLVNKQAVRIDLQNKTVSFQDGEVVHYNRLISTIPLRTLILQASDVPDELRLAAEKLRSTSLLNVTFCLRRPLPHSYHWVYFPEPQFPFFRLVFPSNISPSLAPENCSIISAEISNPDTERRAELEERVRGLLVELGYLERPSEVVLTESTYLDDAYPVHDLAREIRVAKLLEFLKSRDVWSIGRFGAWRYSSIDDAIVEALQAVGQICQPSLQPLAKTSV